MNLYIKLNRAQLEQYRAYLDQQETKLADNLLLAALPPPGAILHLHGSGHMRLTQALQIMTTRIKELKESDCSVEEWKLAASGVNRSLGEYAQILNESVEEFLKQLHQLDIFAWNEEFYETVAAFKELLAHRSEDLIWVYRRLEELFLVYRATCLKKKNFWALFGKVLGPFNSILNRKILALLVHSGKLLSREFKLFSKKFSAYNDFSEKEIEKEAPLFRHAIFIDLPRDKQSFFLKLFRMLSLWEEDKKRVILDERDLSAYITNFAKAGIVTSYLKEYLRVIRHRLFRLSQAWQDSYDRRVLAPIKELKGELVTMNQMVHSYRDVLLHSDPIKKRFKLTHWLTGPEPRKTRDLLQLLYEIEMVTKWQSHLISAVEKGKVENHYFQRQALKKQMDDFLYEMGQPLSSRGMLQLKAEGLIELVDRADELGGSMGDVTPCSPIFS